MTMGDRIRARRNHLGLTQAELARRADVQMQTVWRYEHDEQVPRVDAIDRIATALGVTTDFIIRGAPAAVDSDPTDEPRASGGE